MDSYKSPGVYVEEIAHLPPSIAYIGETAPAFIGYTQKAQRDQPGDLHFKAMRIGSLLEYEHYFGQPQAETGVEVLISQPVSGKAPITGALRSKSLAIKSGVNTRIPVLAEAPKATAKLTHDSRSLHILYYALQMYFANGGGACYIVSVGDYKAIGSAIDAQDLNAGLQAVRGVDSITLLAMPEAQALTAPDYLALHSAALAQCAAVNNRFLMLDVPATQNQTVLDMATRFRAEFTGSDFLKFGAAYAPNLACSLSMLIDEAATIVKYKSPSVLAPTTLQALAKSDAGLYQLALQTIREIPCELPPSALVAAIYKVTEQQRGYWKAPANVSLSQVIQPVLDINDKDQAMLNIDDDTGKSINAIRYFLGKGTLVWGARTLAGNDNEWRYINISRMVRGIETSFARAMEPFIFEANDAQTWNKVCAMAEQFLLMLWRNGGLQGTTPQQAFYAKMGLNSTMTALDILEGRMILELGLATIRPAEFIVTRITQRMSTS